MRRDNVARAVGLLAVCMITFGTLARSANAQPTPIPVPNGGFEARETFDPFPEGTDKYNLYADEDWRHFEISHNGGPLRIWNPGVPEVDETTQGALDVGFGGNAPEGDYVVVVRSRQNDSTNVPEDPQIRDLEAAVQILSDTFDPTSTYTLTAKVGQLIGSVNYTPDWHGYAVQLAVGGTNIDGARFQGQVVGGTVIAEDYNSLTVPVDTFVTSTVTYTPDPAHADLAGLPLQIRLAALEDPDDHSLTGWVAFDDVQLTVSNVTSVTFVRGDCNGDGGIDISDPIFLLNGLFGGGPLSTCTEATDVNDDEGVNIADPVFLLNRLFGGGPNVPAPNPTCGPDPAPEGLGCESFPPCAG